MHVADDPSRGVVAVGSWICEGEAVVVEQDPGRVELNDGVLVEHQRDLGKITTETPLKSTIPLVVVRHERQAANRQELWSWTAGLLPQPK